MPFLEELRRAWAQCPPLRRLLAASLGFQAAAASIEELSRAARHVSGRRNQMMRALSSGDTMASDNQVEIRFSASTDDALAGIERIRLALSGLTAPVKALRQALSEQKILLNAEASQFQITQNQKFALLEAETQKEYEAELALLQQEAAYRRAEQSASGRRCSISITELEAKAPYRHAPPRRTGDRDAAADVELGARLNRDRVQFATARASCRYHDLVASVQENSRRSRHPVHRDCAKPWW